MNNPFRNIHLTYNMCERAKRASAQNHVFSFLRKVRLSQVIYTLIKFSHLCVPKLLFLSMFELVLTNFVCMFVGYFVVIGR